MFDLTMIPLFLVTSFVLTITPGPFTLYVLNRSMRQGAQVGILACVGAAVATEIHSLIAAFGGTTVFMGSVSAINVLRFTGVAYLLYLGVQTLLSKEANIHLLPSKKLTRGEVFYQSFMTGFLNPKVALFCLVYLPQFVRFDTNSAMTQFIVLGGLFNILRTTWFVCLAFLAGQLRAWLNRHPHCQKLQKWLTGCTFIGLSINVALAR